MLIPLHPPQLGVPGGDPGSIAVLHPQAPQDLPESPRAGSGCPPQGEGTPRVGGKAPGDIRDPSASSPLKAGCFLCCSQCSPHGTHRHLGGRGEPPATWGPSPGPPGWDGTESLKGQRWSRASVSPLLRTRAGGGALWPRWWAGGDPQGALLARWPAGHKASPAELARRRVPALRLACSGSSAGGERSNEKNSREEEKGRSADEKRSGRRRRPVAAASPAARGTGGTPGPPTAEPPHGLLGARPEVRRHGQNHLPALPGGGGEGPARQGRVSASGGSQPPNFPCSPPPPPGRRGRVGGGGWVLCSPCAFGGPCLHSCRWGPIAPKARSGGSRGLPAPSAPSLPPPAAGWV